MQVSNENLEINHLKSELTGISDTHSLFEIFDYYIDMISDQLGNGFSTRTLKYYKTSKHRLLEFVKKKYRKLDVDILDIDYAFIVDN